MGEMLMYYYKPHVTCFVDLSYIQTCSKCMDYVYSWDDAPWWYVALKKVTLFFLKVIFLNIFAN